MKPTNTNIANYYGLTRQTIATYKKDKPRTYEALKKYLMECNSKQLSTKDVVVKELARVKEYLETNQKGNE